MRRSRTVTLLLGLLTSSAGLGAEPAPAPTGDYGKVVQMQEFKTQANFSVDCQFQPKTHKLKIVKITWAAPAFMKAGLKPGDSLVSIDGKAVTDLTVEELVKLMPIESSQLKRTYAFEGRRGQFGGDKWAMTAEFNSDPSKSPALSTSPVPSSTPVAAKP